MRAGHLDHDRAYDGAAGPVYNGLLKSYSHKEGYGFIKCPELWPIYRRDVYVHSAQLPEGVGCGAQVRFSVVMNRLGQPQAREVVEVDTAESDLSAADNLFQTSFTFETCSDLPLCSGGQLRFARLVSWNILAPSYCSCAYFKDVEPEALRWSRRSAQVRQVLHALSGDIVCLQEVELHRPLKELGLDGYAYSQLWRTGSRADGCLIAWRADRFSLVREHIVNFDDFIPQGANVGSLEEFRTGHCAVIVELHPWGSPVYPNAWTILVATTHLAWGEQHADVRLFQITALLEELQRFESCHVFLCGDLNSPPGDVVYETLSSYGFISSYQDVETGEGERAVATCSHSSGAGGAGFAEVIDYCWVLFGGAWVHRRLRLPLKQILRRRLGGEPAPSPLPTMMKGGHWPSDHYPVAVDALLWEEPLSFGSEELQTDSSRRRARNRKRRAGKGRRKGQQGPDGEGFSSSSDWEASRNEADYAAASFQAG